MTAEKSTPTNRLAGEKSPYLLQHAHNPVDWYPWGDEAFDKARREDKPVLLSIGYSTCHWCHVMEEESFSDPETASVMNAHFVSIKVDREERPDLDHVYMSYVMAATGSGGWPMTVLLTPDRKPFYGGTYFPPEDRAGMPGFKTLLRSIAEAWKTQKSEIEASADRSTAFLVEQSRGYPSADKLSETTLKDHAETLAAGFDAEWGGFGRAPKFPRSPAIASLFRWWNRSGDSASLAMAEKTLARMAEGGLFDQIGGGFHRYSTDTQWRIPHFEKMLYDQALITRAYLEAYQLTRKTQYADVARETLDYVRREMTGPEGAFFSAQDADSVDPDDPSKKREGVFYVWTKTEIERAVGKKDAGIVCFLYGIREKGNALQDPHGEFTDRNVLYRAETVESAAKHFGVAPEEVRRTLESAKKKLFESRSSRPKPYLDDKVLADWNGLMIAAFAQAAQVLDDPSYADLAARAADFVLTRMRSKDGRLLHRTRGGSAGITATLNDYAAMIEGCVELYQATFDERWLGAARELAGEMTSAFWDEERGGFYLTEASAKDLITRPKEVYDGAVPSGNSMAATALFKLARLTGDGKFEAWASRTLEAFSGEVTAAPSSYPQMLVALDFAVGPAFEAVIAADPGDASARSTLREIHSHFMPNKVILWRKTNERPTYSLCQNRVCDLPTADAAEFVSRLTAKPQTTTKEKGA